MAMCDTHMPNTQPDHILLSHSAKSGDWRASYCVIVTVTDGRAFDLAFGISVQLQLSLSVAIANENNK